MTADDALSETSPLLPKLTVVSPEPAHAPNGALQNASVTDGHAEEDFKPVDEEQAHRNEDSEYKGLPEVKARLKYIVPALAIGVQRDHQRRKCTEAENNRSSCPLPIRRSS